METRGTIERVQRPVGLGALVFAVVVGGCGPRQAALSPSGDGGGDVGSVGGSRGGGGSGGVVRTTGSGTSTSTSTTTTWGDTGTGDTGTSGGVVNYYGPCPSGLDEECPQNWAEGMYANAPPGLAVRCLRPVENGVVYSVCEPEAFVESPQNGGGIFCPEVVDESWMGIVAYDYLPQGESFCRILCLKPDDTCPSGMVCRNGARCYWKHE